MSIYKDKAFAEFWNERAGEHGEAYKRLVLDPIMFAEVGNFKDKVVLELGCGNGYLASRFLEEGVSPLFLMDISEHNLKHASEKVKNKNVEYMLHDATEPWPITAHSLDVIYSNMMLNEVENIGGILDEAFKALRPDGLLVFSVTHPVWDFYVFAQEQVGVKSDKIKGLGGYFRRGYAKFIMSTDDPSSVHLKRRAEKFEVEHYQRPVSDYFTSLRKASFKVDRFIEPEPNQSLIDAAPGFSKYLDIPISMVFICSKEH